MGINMNEKNIVLIYLSLSLLVLQWVYIKSERRNAFLEGKQAVYDSFAVSDTEGYCFADKPPHKGQCEDKE